MTFHWSEDMVLLLIEKFRDNEILWNPAHPDYKTRAKRNDELKVIAHSFATDVNEIERKLKNLTSHYYREKKKLEEARKTGVNTTAKWFAYKALDFLKDKNRSEAGETTAVGDTNPRKRRYSEDISEALKVIKEATTARDEATIFGEYIATKIRRMDAPTSSTVQHIIHKIIYDAEMGLYSSGFRASTTEPLDYEVAVKTEREE